MNNPRGITPSYRRVSEMKAIYKMMKNYAYNDMCSCSNCGVDFYFGGCCEGAKCLCCGCEDSDKFTPCGITDFFEYVVNSVQEFDDSHIVFTMYGKTVNIDLESSTAICKGESGSVERCDIDEHIINEIRELHKFYESCEESK